MFNQIVTARTKLKLRDTVGYEGQVARDGALGGRGKVW
jgi:hypothetical protein